MAAGDKALDAARAAVQRERAARAEWEASLAAQREAVRVAYTETGMGPTPLGRAIDLHSSTVRHHTSDLARARRQERRTGVHPD